MGLREYSFDYFAVNVGQAEIAALVAVRQPRVVKAKQVQQRGLQVVNVDLVAGYGEAQFVGFAVGYPRLDSAAGQEHRVTVGIVVSAQNLAFSRTAFAERRAAEFAAAND